MKFYKEEVSTKIIPEMERKAHLFPLPKGYTLEKALVSLYGPDNSLKNSEYFDYFVTLDDIIPHS